MLPRRAANATAMRRGQRKSRSIVPMWRRASAVPPAWRVVDDSGEDSFGRALPGPDTQRLELWRLTLEARNIPHLIVGHGSGQRVFVPPLHEGLARAELAALRDEAQKIPFPALPVHHNAFWTLLALFALVFWHGLRMAWWPLPFEHVPDPDYWLGCGKLDVYRVIAQGEWWRLATSLTLHSDSQHLFSNVLLGAPFAVLLARRLGLGVAMALTLLAGMAGNGLDALYQPYYHSHVGFSTALFGMVGILCADTAMRDRGPDWKRRFLLPLAAGMALLAMLGSDGERTDYTAHIFGLIAGLGCGVFSGAALRERAAPRALQAALTVGVFIFMLWAWEKAFQ